MRSRTLLLGLVIMDALIAGYLGLLRWRSDRAMAQLTPLSDVRWEGYVIEHESLPPGTREFQVGQRIRVSHGESRVFERDVWVGGEYFLAPTRGFVAGLDVDTDPDLELVVCRDGAIDSFFDPDAATGRVRTVSGPLAEQHARDLCDEVGWNRRPGFLVACCVFALSVPVLIWAQMRAQRERREEHPERTTF